MLWQLQTKVMLGLVCIVQDLVSYDDGDVFYDACVIDLPYCPLVSGAGVHW